MTRDRLDSLREKTRLLKKALDRYNMLRAALADADTARIVRERDVSEEMRRAGIPEGDAFENSGLVVWQEDHDGLTLNHVFLAYYRDNHR